MGACAPKRRGLKPRAALRGPFVPDVSYYQGRPNWAAAKPHISGAIVRVADGNFNDPAFGHNWYELKRLGIWHASYYFLRPYNCAGQADRALAIIGSQGGLDSGPLIADAEVPLNYGCAAAFVAEAKRRSGLPEVIYTSPGTWAGGPHGNAALWVASYGPTPGCVWTCSHVAWQFTDGSYGPQPHCTPGIGCDDISLDRGITSLKRSNRHALEARRRALRRVLERYGCRRRVRQHQHLGPRCRRWKHEGDVVNRELRATA